MSAQNGKRGSIRVRNEARILMAAERLFARNGYAGTTTAAIAASAGLPKANVHYYFATKRAIYRAVLERTLRLWLSAFDPFTEEDDPAEALAAYIRTKMRHSRDHPQASRIFASEILSGAPEIKSFLEGELKGWVARKARVVEAWAAAGRITPIDPLQLFFVIWATTQHYADFAVQIAAVAGPAATEDHDRMLADGAQADGDAAAKGKDRCSTVPPASDSDTPARAATGDNPAGRDGSGLRPDYLDAAGETIVGLILRGLGLSAPQTAGPDGSARALGGEQRRGANDQAVLPLRL